MKLGCGRGIILGLFGALVAIGFLAGVIAIDCPAGTSPSVSGTPSGPVCVFDCVNTGEQPNCQLCAYGDNACIPQNRYTCPGGRMYNQILSSNRVLPPSPILDSFGVPIGLSWPTACSTKGDRNWVWINIQCCSFKEQCNGRDDDGDGVVDNGADICPGGQVCNSTGQCISLGAGYYFGGIYSSRDKMPTYLNPLTSPNGLNCPEGYTATQVYGANSDTGYDGCALEYLRDSNVFVCIGDKSENPQLQRASAFGGGYSSQYNNPLTGSKSCPANYQAIKFMGDGSDSKACGGETHYCASITCRYSGDVDAYLCYNQTITEEEYLFGGMFGGWEENDDGWYINNFTGAPICPEGYTAQLIAKNNDEDNSLYYCYAIAHACTPNCTGRDCGDDGCGGTCGTCSGTETCNSTGQCVNVLVNNQDTILRLSAKTNAFGANATFNSYIYNVSYKGIFGSNYPGQNPHTCNGRNAILKLNASSGAVAFAPNATGDYKTICYGDLKCELKTACVAGEREVVALSDVKNASLALPGESSYPYKICCLSGVERGYHWLNANNQVITAANVDSKVKLVARTGLGENVRVNFTIWENDDINSDDLIRTSLIANTSADGIVMFNWTITESDMTKAEVGELSEGNKAEFYFVAEYIGREANDPGRSPLLITSSYGAVCNLIFIDDDGDESAIRYCDDYNNVITGDKQSQCEEDCNDAADNDKDIHEDDLESGESIINSKCDWIEEDSECVYSYDISTGVGDDDDGDDSFVPGTCKQSVSYTSACSEGYRTANYTYKKEISINGVKTLKTKAQIIQMGQQWDCIEDSIQQIPCPTAMQEVLPFFSVFNMVAAMAVIALVYVVVLFRREFR